MQLYTHSDYSLLESLLTVESLVKQSGHLGLKSLALTDHNTTAGHGEFERFCRQQKIKPIFGLELDVVDSQVVFLALNEEGYGHLLQLASQPKPVQWEELLRFRDGLALLEGGKRGKLTKLIEGGKLTEAQSLHAWLEEKFCANYYIRHELGQRFDPFEVFPEDKFVLCQDVRYLKANSLLSMEVLGKIKGVGTPLPKQPLLSWEELTTEFQGPRKVLQTTLDLAQRCNVELTREQRLPTHPDGHNLEDLARQGAKKRYVQPSHTVLERLAHELSIIRELGYEDYFLIVADIVRFAKDAKIPVGPGRGSAASSLVAYVLGITEVDPLEWGLLFERFLNTERNKRPDIDLDFCYERRGEVLSYVLNRFGRHHVAQIGTYGTFGSKAAAQEVKRVLGEEDPAVAREIQGLKRHRSTHAAGIIISAKPIQAISAVYLDRDLPVTHLDMYALEDLGVLKIDLLALRTITLLQHMEAAVHVKDASFSLAKIPIHDEQTLSLLGQGQSLGIFQLESELFGELLRKLRPRSFHDLVALLALGRPGPLSMFSEFVARRDEPSKISYLHPGLKEILGETYGLILYQEQVMQIANQIGGLSLGEADLLRSALGKDDPKIRAKWRERFVSGAKEQSGLSNVDAEKLFQMVAKFSGYAFNKAHSVSYALLTWQAAYLKTHFPGEFFATHLNQGSTGKERSHYLLDAKGAGVKVLPPSVKYSEGHATVAGKDLRLGLTTNRLITPQIAQEILRGRRNWQSLEQFRRSVALDDRTLETLLFCGAFDDLGSRHGHLRELGLGSKGELEFLRMEKELLGVYVSGHPASPFLPLVKNLRGEWDVAAGEILETKMMGRTRQGVLDTPEGLVSFRSFKSVPKGRVALYGESGEDGIFKVSWAFPLGPTVLITPTPENLTLIKDILEDEGGSLPTILLLGDAYHLLPRQFWVKDTEKIERQLAEGRIVYTWLDPWKENV